MSKSHTPINERILGYQLSEIFMVDELKSVSGGAQNGTRSLIVEMTDGPNGRDTEVHVNLDW